MNNEQLSALIAELSRLQQGIDYLGSKTDEIYTLLNGYMNENGTISLDKPTVHTEKAKHRLGEPITSEIARLDPATTIMQSPAISTGLLDESIMRKVHGGHIQKNMDIENVEAHGGFKISGNVSFRNCRIVGDGKSEYGIITDTHGKATLVNCEISGDFFRGGFSGDHIKFINCDFVDLDCPGGYLGNRVYLDRCYIGDFVPGNGRDGLIIDKPVGAVKVTNTLIETPVESGSNCLLFSARYPSIGEPEPIVIDNCVFSGGDYAVAFDPAGPEGSFGDLVFVNNVFKDDHQWGPRFPNNYKPMRWENNKLSNGTIV